MDNKVYNTRSRIKQVSNAGTVLILHATKRKLSICPNLSSVTGLVGQLHLRTLSHKGSYTLPSLQELFTSQEELGSF